MSVRDDDLDHMILRWEETYKRGLLAIAAIQVDSLGRSWRCADSQMNLNAVAIDHSGVPIIGTATNGSPIVHMQNCLLANFGPSLSGGVLMSSHKTYPSGTLKSANNVCRQSQSGERRRANYLRANRFRYQLAVDSTAIARPPIQGRRARLPFARTSSSV